MKKGAALLVCAALLAGQTPAGEAPAAGATAASNGAASPWPAATRTARPWLRWWWPGSAVEPAELTRHLEQFAQAGIGGVEITPIYGARGAEARYIDYLSPRWVEMLAHTAREAKRLGLGVDMATGTGWPFGGPTVSASDGSRSLHYLDGKPAGKPTEMKVKRAAPGGEGLVLDPYAPAAMERYLEQFTKALSPLPPGAVRSQFHDSFEYFNASWSSALPAAFFALNGYDIREYGAELLGEKPMDPDTLGRIKGDYRRALASMHLEYLNAWVSWSHAHGFKARNQAHGSPGRLLDLYGASDMPETESFGATVLPIPGLRQDAGDIREDPDPPVNLIGRFASSAAHVNARALVSSETLTWLRENFRESPSQAKPQLDRLFVAGINHVFYHGSTYSPADVAWPGWFFYAATQLNPTNPLWHDFAAMHAYVTRVQSVLQAGQPDNDILLYWPEADEQDDAEGLMRQHGMHENEWLEASHAGRVALSLLAAGYSFDFISDAQLRQVQVRRGRLVSGAGTEYSVVVVPRTRRMPLATVAALGELASRRGNVIFEGLPQDVPGLGNLEARRAGLKALLAKKSFAKDVELVRHLDCDPVLAGARAESMARSGLWHVRRTRGENGTDYFIVNDSPRRFDGWVTLNSRPGHAALMDPLTGAAGLAASDGKSPQPRVYLQLDIGQSVIVRTFASKPDLAPWRYVMAGEPRVLEGSWRLRFVSGGPAMPRAVELEGLQSWTTLADPEARRFSGTARYRVEFRAPAERADDWLLDLGDVRETARVTLNGRYLGTAWSLPAGMRLGAALMSGTNVLEVDVTNLPANRVRDLDQRKVDWKIMNDINLASLRYKALDAASWDPQPSGLLGPVRLVPLRQVSAPDPAPEQLAVNPAPNASCRYIDP
jgi:hypothetical protein